MSPPSRERKRKYSNQTISDLFTAQQKPVPVTEHLVDSPTGKRFRLEKASNAAALAPSPIAVKNMYEFKKNNNKAEVVDLTKTDSGSRTSNNARPTGVVRRPIMNPHGGAKRLVVKNMKPPVRFDKAKYLEEVWVKLDNILDIVFQTATTSFSLEEAYRSIENVVRQNNAEELLQRLEKKCSAYIGGPMKDGLKEKLNQESVEVLKAVLSAWALWVKQLEIINLFWTYLDRAYLVPKQHNLKDILVWLFRDIIFDGSELENATVLGACNLITADRQGGCLDQKTLGDAVKMFHAIQRYTTLFEPKFLAISQDFVNNWANKNAADLSLPEYVRESLQLIKTELSRVEAFSLDLTTRNELLSQLDYHLVYRHQDKLVNEAALADLLEHNAVEELKQLYELLDRKRLGARLGTGFNKWIKDTGTAIVFDEKDQENMVVKLLCLKRQLDLTWKAAFRRNEELGHGLRESFEAFINKTKKSGSTWNTDNSKPAEMIAKYVDRLLKGGVRAIPAQMSAIAKMHVEDEDENEDGAVDEDAEMNSQLDQVLDLFRFVHGKAVFEAFYKKDLARRLLMGRSASADAERSMLSRLKTECGSGFTSNLEQMFKDIELGREEMASYRAILDERRERRPFDLGVMILSASAWPTYPDVTVIIPPQVKQAIDKFEAYYKSKHSGRKLDWKHGLATCQLKAQFPQGKKELVVSSFQAIVLLLFNGLGDNEKLSYDHIKQATGLSPQELSRTLQSLACAKVRPLTKHPKGRDINSTDTFSINNNFSDPKYRIKVNTVQLKETKEENKETHERVAEDRNYETQAAIVRILKARKTIAHSELIAEVINATKKRGTLDMPGIKRNIDRLIEKDFLERNDNGGYNYVS